MSKFKLIRILLAALACLSSPLALALQMTPGTTFKGNSGITYSSGGGQQEIGSADVRQALINGWHAAASAIPPTVAQLPDPGKIPPSANVVIQLTSDQGLVYDSGNSWTPIGTGGGGGDTTPGTLQNKNIDGGQNTLTNIPASALVGPISVDSITGQWSVANGGTGVSTLTGVCLGNGTNPMTAAAGSDIAAAFTGGSATSAYYLAADGTKQLVVGGGAGGANTQVQYNSSGAFAGDSGFTYAGSGALTLSASLTVPTITAATQVSAGRINVTGTPTATNGFALPTGNTPTAYSNGAARFQWTSSGITLLGGGNFVAGTAGMGIQIKEGTNAKMGVATLVAGTVTVSNTAVTANSRIFLTAQSLGTVTSPSALTISARTAGTSFTILASQNTDTSVVAWQIVEPAP